MGLPGHDGECNRRNVLVPRMSTALRGGTEACRYSHRVIATDVSGDGPLLRALRDRRVGFVLVGGVNTVIGLAWFAFFHLLLGDVLGYLGVLVLAYAFAMTIAYTLHRRLVFRARGPFVPGLLRYSIVNVGSLLLNAVLLSLAVSALHLPVLPAQCICTLFTVAISYVAHARFSFAHPRSGSASSAGLVEHEETPAP